jgi:hypothetical protein
MRFGLATIMMIALLSLVGRTAEAQARGSVQATATVVDTHQGFAALSAVRQALSDGHSMVEPTVTTVAEVRTSRAQTDPHTLVVTIDFSRN